VDAEDAGRAGRDRQTRILDAVLDLLSEHGISGVSMRSVAREAGVSLGLLNYHYTDKTGLIRAALLRVEEQDIELVHGESGDDPVRRLQGVLERVVAPEFLTTPYLSLRLQLWSLAQVHEDFAAINTAAQKRYRSGLARLIQAARPDLSRRECNQRAADIDVIQNGLWLTSLLGLDKASIVRSVDRCKEIALGGSVR
jgi:TetR/AcrR family transcriptional regulator, cholesterol catabolism regulator